MFPALFASVVGILRNEGEGMRAGACMWDRDGLLGLSIFTSTVPCLRNSMAGAQNDVIRIKIKTAS